MSKVSGITLEIRCRRGGIVTVRLRELVFPREKRNDEITKDKKEDN